MPKRRHLRTLHSLHGGPDPKPFSFIDRDRQKRKTISTVRLEQDLALKAELEAALLARPFRAKPIPKSTLERNPENPNSTLLWDRMQQEAAFVSEQRRAEAKERLMQSQRPFSFYQRQLARVGAPVPAFALPTPFPARGRPAELSPRPARRAGGGGDEGGAEEEAPRGERPCGTPP